MYKIISRVKTDGSYTKCAKMENARILYSNKIEDIDFETLEDCLNYLLKEIFQKNVKARVYYIVSDFERSRDLNSIGNEFLDAGNNYFIRQKYSWFDNKWVRQKYYMG